MTPMQLQVLDYVRDMITRAGFAPTYEEIAVKFGFVKSQAHRHVRALAQAGKLRTASNRMRGIELADSFDLRIVDSQLLRAELARRGEEPGALIPPARRPVARGTVACAASCCDVPVRPGQAFCLFHWRRISPATQTAFLSAHKVACETRTSEDALRYQEAFGKAKDEAEGAPWACESAH